jgi:hypothetical protein
MSEKSKINSQRLSRICFLCLLWSILSVFYPALWLAPQYQGYTWIIYLLTSLIWLPFALRYLVRFRGEKVLIALTVICFLSNIVMANRVYSLGFSGMCNRPSMGSPLSNKYHLPIFTCLVDSNYDGIRDDLVHRMWIRELRISILIYP